MEKEKLDHLTMKVTKTEEQNLINKFKTKEIRNLTNLMSDIRIKKQFQKQILIFKIKCS